MVTNTSKARGWSPAPQESSLKADKDQKLAAGQNPFGDKPIGDTLNEIADPNWIDPKKVQREANKDLNKDAFFKLMLTQMKNQDPTNPLPSHEMAAQLAQFTSLEQLFNVNSNLEELKKAQSPMADYQVLNFMGKNIAADSSKIVRNKGDKTHELKFDLTSDAATAEITVKDAEGKVVRKFTAHDLKKGTVRQPWNGMTDDQQVARAGDYSFTVDAKTLDGKKVGAQTAIQGRITGVNYTSKGPVLLIGDQSVYLSDVKKIEDPDLKAQEKNKAAAKPGLGLVKPETPAAVKLAPQASAQTPSADDVPGAEDPLPNQNNLDTVAMSAKIKDMVDKAQGKQ